MGDYNVKIKITMRPFIKDSAWCCSFSVKVDNKMDEYDQRLNEAKIHALIEKSYRYYEKELKDYLTENLTFKIVLNSDMSNEEISVIIDELFKEILPQKDIIHMKPVKHNVNSIEKDLEEQGITLLNNKQLIDYPDFMIIVRITTDELGNKQIKSSGECVGVTANDNEYLSYKIDLCLEEKKFLKNMEYLMRYKYFPKKVNIGFKVYISASWMEQKQRRKMQEFFDNVINLFSNYIQQETIVYNCERFIEKALKNENIRFDTINDWDKSRNEAKHNIEKLKSFLEG